MLHGASGLSRDFLTLADEVARAGFLVVVGCWQAGEAKTPGNVVCADATPQADWIADPAANSGKELIAMAKSLPDAQANRVGLYGVSRGGHAALWAASTGAGVKAVVADAPAHRPAIAPAPASPQTVLAGLDVPLPILHGTADQSIPVESRGSTSELPERSANRSRRCISTARAT
jgi:dienelactone hydrolase